MSTDTLHVITTDLLNDAAGLFGKVAATVDGESTGAPSIDTSTVS